PAGSATVAALQKQFSAQTVVLESQERRIRELFAQVAALQARSNVVANYININEYNKDEGEETDIVINAKAGLAPHTKSSPSSEFSHCTDQACHVTTTPAHATDASLHVIPAQALTAAPAHAVPPATTTALVTPTAPAPVTPLGDPVVLVGSKILHPGGRVNHGCKLREAMGLTYNVDLYKEIHRKVLWMFTRTSIPINVYWKYQDQQKLLAISTAVIEAFPYLRNFEPPSWPVYEMLKIMLRNKRGYRKRTAPTTAEGWPVDTLDSEIEELEI
ncbi:unnamed protein product, partial [Rhizoctonia solani]